MKAGNTAATHIRRVERAEPALLPGLCELLQDSVHGGASVGFLAPVTLATATAYWSGVFEQLPEQLRLWVAEDQQGQLAGSVQLDLCAKENGRHRGEVQKLFVHTRARGRGIATQLLGVLEQYARANARTLLVLDTLTGSHAETVYRHLGWSFVGLVPEYAGTPTGELRATAIFYKRLA